jgi:nitroreductase
MKTFLDLARNRRSIRKYTSENIASEDVAKILEAGRLAPSGNNAQPWRFIVVRDEGVKRRLSEVAGKYKFIIEAPVVIAVVADPRAKMKSVSDKAYAPSASEPPVEAVIKAVRDTTIAADHIVMAATDLGLGTCWVAKFEQEDIKPVLDVPEACYVTALITVGHSAERPDTTPRYALHEIVFEENYGRRSSCNPNKLS